MNTGVSGIVLRELVLVSRVGVKSLFQSVPIILVQKDFMTCPDDPLLEKKTFFTYSDIITHLVFVLIE